MNQFFWRRAHLYPDGSILAIHDGMAILKLDRNSRVLWARDISAHHDLEVLPGGDIYTLTREPDILPRVDPDTPVLEDFVTLLGPDAELKQSFSLLRAMELSEPRYDWRKAWMRFWELEKTRQLVDSNADLFHTNAIEILRADLGEEFPQFAAGNVLVFFRNLDMIAVVDPESRTTQWAAHGLWVTQHDPHISGDGSLLVFDNNWQPERSRVVETDLRTGETRWQYMGTDSEPFWSRTCGAVQRLDNGNTLITESDAGRAFEVDSSGTIVWEFSNPHRAGDEQQFIATLFELLRVPADFPVDWAGAGF